MGTMTDLQKIKTARILAGAAFWVSIGVWFFTGNGLSESQAYTLVSLYYVSVVLFEFPTGVIGDHFSHKTALVAGYIIAALALIFLGLGGGFAYTAGCLVLGAIGITLVSGSDTALTHALSGHFKKDQAQIKLYITVVLVGATALGPLLSKLHAGLPFIVTGICNLIAALCVWRIRNAPEHSKEGDIFRTAGKGLDEVRHSPFILHLIILSAASAAFLLSLKWFYNPLLETMGIPLEYWGVIMGLGLLMPLLGIRAYQRSPKSNIAVAGLLLIASIVPIGIIQLAIVSISAMYITYAISGYLDVALDVALNEHIQSNGRAGILSLGSLLSRLGGSMYMPLAGFMLERNSFIVLMASTAGLLLTVCAASLWYLRRTQNAATIQS